MIFRQAKLQDITQIMEIISLGIESLKKQGSPQWQDGYGPTQEQVKQDIENGAAYVLVTEKVIAYAALIAGVDPVYTAITEGTWCTSQDYVSIHRVVVDSRLTGNGLAQQLLNDLIITSQQMGFNDIRIDTHPVNTGMQKVIQKAGFTYRGKVNFPIPYGNRWAYQYFIDSKRRTLL